MLSFSLWHPSVIWCNEPCFSCANIPVRMDSGPRWSASCKSLPTTNPPTCCHIWDALYTNTPWLIPVQERIHPCRTASSHTLCTAPDPALGSAHRCSPRPHILMLFGMRCRATVSVNTAPGNSDRKPPQLCGKLDAITECTPICSDNWISVSELLLCHSPLFCFYCKTTPALELCIFSPSAVIFQTINDLISMCWFMNSQHQLPFLLITISSLSPINSLSYLHCRGWPRKCHYWSWALFTLSHQFPAIVGSWAEAPVLIPHPGRR